MKRTTLFLASATVLAATALVGGHANADTFHQLPSDWSNVVYTTSTSYNSDNYTMVNGVYYFLTNTTGRSVVGSYVTPGGFTMTQYSTLSTDSSLPIYDYSQPNAKGLTTTPVYSVAKGNDHYLTTDKNYADTLVASRGYNSEKIAFYTGEAAGLADTQVDSWYNANKAMHFYYLDTTGQQWFVDNAKTTQLKSLGYKVVTPMLFNVNKSINSTDPTDSVPVYVSFNSSGNHYYSVNSALPAGYGNQSIAWYGFGGPNVGQLISNGTSSSSSSTTCTTTPTTTTTPTMGSADISNISAPTAIQTNMTVSGSGQGFHAKVSFNTATAAVSFGIQYDAHGAAPYTGKPSFLIENISLAATEAGNTYTHTGAAQTGTSYKVLLTVTSNGAVTAYVNGTKVGQVTNAGLANTTVYARVQAVGDVNGDVVNATFANTQVKENGSVQNAQTSHVFDQGANVTTNTSEGQTTPTIKIGGTVAGFSGNWSTANPYGKIVQFQ